MTTVNQFGQMAVDDSVFYRTSYTAVSLLCMMILSLMLGEFWLPNL